MSLVVNYRFLPCRTVPWYGETDMVFHRSPFCSRSHEYYPDYPAPKPSALAVGGAVGDIGMQ